MTRAARCIVPSSNFQLTAFVQRASRGYVPDLKLRLSFIASSQRNRCVFCGRVIPNGLWRRQRSACIRITGKYAACNANGFRNSADVICRQSTHATGLFSGIGTRDSRLCRHIAYQEYRCVERNDVALRTLHGRLEYGACMVRSSCNRCTGI